MNRPALLLIDVQQGFDDVAYWGRRNNPDAEGRIADLVAAFRACRLPVIHVQHMSTEPASPLRPGQSGNELKSGTAPREGERVIRKTVNSAFIGTDLEAHLDSAGIEALVIVGITTNHCVSTTARMAGNLGYETFVVSDATATFDRKGIDGRMIPAETMHEIGLAELHGEFATVLTSAQVVARL